MKIKKSQLIKWHVYAGLFTSVYILAFAFSSLVLNHGWDLENKEVTDYWETTLQLDTSLENDALSHLIQDSLQIMGWIPYWEFRRDAEQFKFRVTHFGKDHRITTNLINGRVTVEGVSKGVLATFHGLHFFNGKIPGASIFLRSWAVYQWLTMAVLVISLILGLILWARFNIHKWHLYLFGGLTVVSLIIMLGI